MKYIIIALSLLLTACTSAPVQTLMTASYVVEANDRLAVAISDVSRVVSGEDLEKVRQIDSARKKLMNLLESGNVDDKAILLMEIEFVYIQAKDDYLALKKQLIERADEFTGVQRYNLRRLDFTLTKLDEKLISMTNDEKYAERSDLIRQALEILTTSLYVLRVVN